MPIPMSAIITDIIIFRKSKFKAIDDDDENNLTIHPQYDFLCWLNNAMQ